MNKTQVNPWTWQNPLGYSQAWRMDEPQSIVFVSGQGPLSADGKLVGAGDFDAQARQVLENLRTVLHQSGATLQAVTHMTVYLTDISRLRDYGRIKTAFIPGPQPASTALQVGALAIPGMMIEVAAVAVL
jgi:2-iminobutanoate/2-iminopropanoate deaminase